MPGQVSFPGVAAMARTSRSAISNRPTRSPLQSPIVFRSPLRHGLVPVDDDGFPLAVCRLFFTLVFCCRLERIVLFFGGLERIIGIERLDIFLGQRRSTA